MTVPAGLADALRREPRAGRRFEGLSYSNRQRHVRSIEGARTAETRQRRIVWAVAALRE